MSIYTDAQTLAMYNAENVAEPTALSDPANTVQTVSFTTGVAFQPNPTRSCTLYIDVRITAALAVSIGPVTGAEVPLITSEQVAIGVQTVNVPNGWYVVLTGVSADVVVNAVSN
jgi:hypothetical protein